MAEDAGKQPLAVEPVERIGIGVADAGRHDFHEDFAGARPFEINFDDLQRLLGGKGNGGAGFHRVDLMNTIVAALIARLRPGCQPA